MKRLVTALKLMLFVGASTAWAQCRDGGTVFDAGGWVFSSLPGMTVS